MFVQAYLRWARRHSGEIRSHRDRGAFWRTVAVLVTILVVGALLRSYQIRNESPWWDEVITLRQLDAPSLFTFLSALRHDDPPWPPVYAIAAYAWSQAVSPSVASMRFFSLLVSMATILFLFDLTRMLYGSRAGVVAALAFALSMVHVYFAQEVRAYALIVFLAVVSANTLMRALRGDGRVWWAAHFLTNFVLTFTHLFAVILLGVEGILVLLILYPRSRAIAVWFGVHAVLGALLVWWFFSVDMSTLDGATNWVPLPGWREVALAFVIFAGGRPSNENPATHLPTGVSLDWALALFVYAVVAWFVAMKMREFLRTRNRGDAALAFALLFGLVAPLAVLGVISYLVRPCFVYRYALYSSLALYILFGAAVNAMSSRSRRAGALFVFMALSLYQLSAIATGPFRVDWRGVGEYLAAHAAADDRIIVFQCFNRATLEFNAPLVSDSTDCVAVWSDACGAIETGLESGSSVWFAVWLWTEPDKFEACFRANALAVESVDFKGWPNLRLYHLSRRM